MREFVANFQKKHGQQVPMPKIYGDEDSSDSEGLELAVSRQGAGRTEPQDYSGQQKTAGSARDGSGPSTSGGGVGGSRGRKRGRDDDGDE